MSMTPADLVATVACALRMPVNAVKYYDRRLMEAGLRAKKGHGRGSAMMGPDDAAILIAAIAASDEISRAAECVRTLYALPYRLTPEFQLYGGTAEFPELLHHRKIIGADQTQVDTFGNAFVSVMRYFAANEDITNFPALRVSIAQGQPHEAQLTIVSTTEKVSAFHFGCAIDWANPGKPEGLRVTREIGLFTLNPVADVIAGRARLVEAA